MACCTVVIFSASSSGISVSNSSSSAITSSTVSSESAPRSSTNDDSFLISASLTPNCSATIFLTRCSTFSMLLLPTGSERTKSETREFYQMTPFCPKARSQSLHVHPAVDVQGRAGDVIRLGGGEESDRVRDILGETEPA